LKIRYFSEFCLAGGLHSSSVLIQYLLVHSLNQKSVSTRHVLSTARLPIRNIRLNSSWCL